METMERLKLINHFIFRNESWGNIVLSQNVNYPHKSRLNKGLDTCVYHNKLHNIIENIDYPKMKITQNNTRFLRNSLSPYSFFQIIYHWDIAENTLRVQMNYQHGALLF